MKLICFKPTLTKYWKNGWSSEEVWSVNNTHWGFIEDKFYKQLKTFENLFTLSGNIGDKYVAATISDQKLTDSEMFYAKLLYSLEIEGWKELQKESNMFYSSVCEFIINKPCLIGSKNIRCAAYLGNPTIQLVNFKWWLNIQKLKIKCLLLNIGLKLYYIKYPFKYYENYYSGIDKDRKRFFQELSKTLNKVLKR